MGENSRWSGSVGPSTVLVAQHRLDAFFLIAQPFNKEQGAACAPWLSAAENLARLLQQSNSVWWA